MTAIRKPQKRLNLHPRHPDAIARPMAQSGNHQQIVRKARDNAYSRQVDTYRELAKI